MQYSLSPKNWVKLILTFIAIVVIAILCSCSSVKKTQHLVNEFSKAVSHEKKDSSQEKKEVKQTDISEAESNTKKIDIVFPDAPEITTDAKDFFNESDTSSILKKPSKTKITTNRPAAVKIKANGDIELSSTPKSITITENNNKQKVDSSSETTSNNTAVKSDKEQSTETGKKEVENNVKRAKFFSMWWLLVLLILPIGWAYRNYIKPLKKITDPIKWT